MCHVVSVVDISGNGSRVGRAHVVVRPPLPDIAHVREKERPEGKKIRANPPQKRPFPLVVPLAEGRAAPQSMR